jgi:predicted nucleic acid-binding protein
MKAFLDTSTLVPVFYGDHEHHEASLSVFTRYAKPDVCAGLYSLGEVYSTLTRMPGRYRASPNQAILFIDNVLERVTIVGLSPDEYTTALRSFAGIGVIGGTIYDALLSSCAMKADAELIYTWNVRHYSLCGPEVAQRIRSPLNS